MEIKTYSSLDEKKIFFQPLKEGGKDYWTIDTKSELDDFVKLLSKQKDNIYRGMKEAKYNMFTSLQRAYFTGEISSTTPSSNFVKNEIEQVKQCHNGFLPQYYQSMGIEETDFVYLSFLQHHRAPTPFLDFSRNYRKALYFATENTCYPASNNEIDNYVSLSWVNPLLKDDFIDLIQWMGTQYERAVDTVIDISKQNPEISLDISNLEMQRQLSWFCKENQGTGFHSLDLAYINERTNSKMVKYTPFYIHNKLIELQQLAKRKALTDEDVAILKAEARSCLYACAKLANMNITAQEGCFILFNPKSTEMSDMSNLSLEEYWKKTPIYENMPDLYCANIHKSLCPYIIKEILQDINTQTMFPEADKIADQAYWNTRVLK